MSQLPAGAGHSSGPDLVGRKVKRWVCMGGNFAGSPPRDDLKLGNVTGDTKVVLRMKGGEVKSVDAMFGFSF